MTDNPIEPLADLPAESAALPLTGRRKAFRALRHRNYRLFFAGQLISVIGTWMQTTALPVLIVFQIKPGNPSLWLGIVGFVPLIPLAPLSLIAGSLSDRFSKRGIIVITQSTLMLQAFALAALAATNSLQMWHLLVLTFVAGAANAIDVPARQAFVIEMIDDRADLDSGIALNSAIFNLGRAIGPVIAGLLIAPLGFSAAFLINGLSFLAVIAGLLMMRLPPAVQISQPPRMRAHLIEGVRFVWRHETLKIVMSLVAVSAFLSMPFMTLIPIFVQQPDGALAASAQPVIDAVCGGSKCVEPESIAVGLLMGAFGTGALIGALLVGVYGDRGRGRWLTIGNVGLPLALLAFAVSRSFWLTLVILIGVGVVFILQNVMTNTLVQISSPDGLRGRVMSIYSLAFQGMTGAGRMQAGFTAALIGAPLAVAVGAVASLIYSLFVLFRWPKIQQIK